MKSWSKLITRNPSSLANRINQTHGDTQYNSNTTMINNKKAMPIRNKKFNTPGTGNMSHQICWLTGKIQGDVLLGHKVIYANIYTEVVDL